MKIELDHLVVAATDLESGEAWLRDRLGVPLSAGGQHEGRGTHNKLLQLGSGTYLELIAADPTQPDPAQPRSFMLDDPAMQARLKHSPQLVHFLCRTDDMDAALASLKYLPGKPIPMTRGALRWRICASTGGRPPADGLLPTLIQWDVPADQHPAARLPDAGVRLTRFTVRGANSVIERRPDIVSPIPIDWEQSDEPGLSASLETPRGRVTLG
jgi:hypothetical protein